MYDNFKLKKNVVSLEIFQRFRRLVFSEYKCIDQQTRDVDPMSI